MKKGSAVKFNLNAKAICLIFFLIGLGAIAISNVDFKEPAAWWTSWGKETANNAGTTLLVAGVISFLMEISTLKEFFQSLLKNILNDDFPFDAYSEENLRKFKDLIAAHLSEKNIDSNTLSENTIYSYENKLLELSTKPYYEYHKAHYTVYPKEDIGRIRVNATLDYKIINSFNEETQIKYKTKIYAKSKEEADGNFVLQELKINNQSVSTKNLVKVEKIEKEEGSNYYDYKVKIKKELGKGKAITVHMKYEYYIPITDRVQNYKITMPCLKLEHEIRIKNQWELRGFAFAAFYTRQEGLESKYKVEQTESDLIKVKYNDWVFPGGGYSVYYDKKE